jgi:hypothetical protein
VCILNCLNIWNFVVEVYQNIDEDEEQMKGEDEGRKTKLNVGGTP